MSNWRTLSRSLGAVRGPHGHGPKPFLNKPGQAQGTHGGKAKGGMVRRPRKPSTHGKAIPTLAAKGGRIGLQYGGPPNTGRTNLLEQLGRVEAERSNPNRRAEISRVHGELNRGYAKGGRIGLKKGKMPWGTGPKPGTLEFLQQTTQTPRKKKAIGGPAGRAIKKGVEKALEPRGVFGPKLGKGKGKGFKNPWEKPPQLRKSKKERREEFRKKARKSGSTVVFHDEWKHIDPGLQQGLFKKEGGRIGLKKGGSDKNWIQKAVNPKHKGFCTPMTKKTCTPRRKALARTFKKMGRERKAKG